jgi:hypothetical protein
MKMEVSSMQRRIVLVMVCLLVLSVAAVFVARQSAAAPPQGQAAPAAQARPAPPEANRPPVFFHEGWKHQFDTGGSPEGPLGPQHVASPDLELKTYGEAPKADTQGQGEPHNHAGMWMNKRFKEDPPHIFTGTCNRPCNRPCGMTFKHKTQFVNLADFGTKIRWQVKQSGFHVIRPLIRLANGTYLVGDHTDGWVDAFDWYISEFNIDSVRWRLFDPERVVTIVGQGADAKGWVRPCSTGITTPCADLTKVDEVGFVDLMPGSSHGNGGFSDVGWIEVIGRPVAR